MNDHCESRILAAEGTNGKEGLGVERGNEQREKRATVGAGGAREELIEILGFFTGTCGTARTGTASDRRQRMKDMSAETLVPWIHCRAVRCGLGRSRYLILT